MRDGLGVEEYQWSVVNPAQHNWAICVAPTLNYPGARSARNRRSRARQGVRRRLTSVTFRNQWQSTPRTPIAQYEARDPWVDAGSPTVDATAYAFGRQRAGCRPSAIDTCHG